MYIITYNDNDKYIGLKISNNEILEYDILLDELSDNNIYLGIDNIEHNSYINLLNLYNTNLKDLYKDIYPNKQFKEQKKNKGRRLKYIYNIFNDLLNNNEYKDRLQFKIDSYNTICPPLEPASSYKINLCNNKICTIKPIDDMESKKCKLCDGFFIDDGLNNIYFLEENGDSSCSLCGKTTNICIMKGSGQSICINACNEDDTIDSEDNKSVETTEDNDLEETIEDNDSIEFSEDDYSKIMSINNSSFSSYILTFTKYGIVFFLGIIFSKYHKI